MPDSYNPANYKSTYTASGAHLTEGAPGVDFFTPRTTPRPGSYLGPIDESAGTKVPKLLTPFRLRGLEFKNRVFLSPMAQYSCQPGTGTPTRYHLVHYGQFAMRGIACLMTEATAVSANGRMTPEDVGIWDDKHITPWKQIVDFAHSQGAYMGLQLNHAGRRGSVYTPQIIGEFPNLKSHVAPVDAGGWLDVFSASPLPYYEKYITPLEMTLADIQNFKNDWAAAVLRGIKSGFDVIELHASHGYLLHSFMSPFSNKRTDQYGGSLENRMRLILEIASVTRSLWPVDKPVFCRLSITDHHAAGEKNAAGEYISWGIEQSRIIVKELVKLGIDLVDCTSGGLDAEQVVKAEPGHNAPLAAAIREEFPDLALGSVGLIKTPQQAEAILQSNAADIIHLGRELLRQADFVLNAATEMNSIVQLPAQWHRAITWSNLVIPGP